MAAAKTELGDGAWGGLAAAKTELGDGAWGGEVWVGGMRISLNMIIYIHINIWGGRLQGPI